MSGDAPISDSELDELFGGLQRFRLLLLAVSGGVDSTALMHLIARWQGAQNPAPAIHVATVDHELRPGSLAEARMVADAAHELGLPHHLLAWSGSKPASGVQEAAREARYALMAALLKSLGEPNAALVTAHTADDQAETLLMRLARGSGLDGLSAMAEYRPLASGHQAQLVRPLLAVPKSRLKRTLMVEGITWSEDPSNHRTEFERVRIRAAEGTLCELGLTAHSLSLSARRLQRARTALDCATSELGQRVLHLHDGAYATIDRPAFASAPTELRLRLLAQVLGRFGGSSPPARLAKLESLTERLEHGLPFDATLGGCLVEAVEGQLRVYREPGRTGLPKFDFKGGNPRLWDSRFTIAFDGAGHCDVEKLTVQALGIDGYATLRNQLGSPLPSRAAATLPSFWRGNELLAVPLLTKLPKACSVTGSLSEPISLAYLTIRSFLIKDHRR